jgi:hypothetical protein
MYINLKQAKLILFVGLLISNIATNAQQVEAITAKFPNALAAFTNISREVNISNKDGGLYIETVDEKEIILLSDKASGIYNKGRVYHGSFDEVKLIEAYTKVPDGNKFKKIKVTEFKTESSKSNSVFYDDSKETVFDFPSTTLGSLCYQKSIIAEKDIHLLTPFYFSNYLPALNTSFTIEYPSNVNLKYLVKNDNQKIISIIEDTKGRTKKLSFTTTDLKDRDYYGNAPGFSYTEPHVIFYIASYTDNDDKKVTVFETVNDFYKWNYSHLKTVNKEPSADLQKLTDSITQNCKTQKDKAKNIFTWVQNNVKYVAFEDGLEGFVPRQAKDVCSKKYGDCKDMASLLTVMLNNANIKAYYTWIGTRDIAYDYNDVHLPITDNHMICAANIDEKWYFLDATDPHCIFGMPTHGIQNKQALIAIDEENYKIERVPVIEHQTNEIIDSTVITLNGNNIKGNIAVHFSGYCGSDTYNYLSYKDEVQTKDYVKAKTSKGSNKFLMNEYTVKKYDIANKKLSFNVNFELPGYAKQIGDEYYINLNLDKLQANTFIDTAKRKVDVEYDYKYNWKQYTILTLPDGYEVNYLPKNYSTITGDFGMIINYEKKGNQIVLYQQFLSNTLQFEVNKFSEWNKTVKELNSQYKEQVVLKKLK